MSEPTDKHTPTGSNPDKKGAIGAPTPQTPNTSNQPNQATDSQRKTATPTYSNQQTLNPFTTSYNAPTSPPLSQTTSSPPQASSKTPPPAPAPLKPQGTEKAPQSPQLQPRPSVPSAAKPSTPSPAAPKQPLKANAPLGTETNKTASSPAPSSPPAPPVPPASPAASSKATVAAKADATPVKEATETRTLSLGERLVSKGLISKDQLSIAQREQKEQTGKKEMLGSILVRMGFITESTLGAVLTETSGVRNFNLSTAVLDSNLVNRIPKELAKRHKVIPVGIQDDQVLIAITDIYNILALDQINRYFPPEYKIVPVYSPESDIIEAIEQYYEFDLSIEGILKEIETGITGNNISLSGETEGYTNPTVRLVDSLLIDAVKKGASDIHFEPEGSFLRLRYRIDGQLIQVRSFHKGYWSAISVRIKIMSGLNIAETRIPQDGRITYNVLGGEVDFRVASHPTVHGENIVMRILDKKKALKPLDQLGYSPHNEKLLKRMLKRPEGIIIVTGPTGSGKTTTLYSMLNYINEVGVNIMTLEDPVEYQLPLIRQSQVREGSSMGFVDGIKSLMRQDPDIIFIGEIRDEATANMAIRASMTGHQVFTTLHSNDALSALPRLVDIGIPPHLLSGSLIGTTAQRLARRLCTHCREKHVANEEECRILNADLRQPPEIYHPVGCKECYGSGYKGRTAISEILVIDREIDELIAIGATYKTILQTALEKGFVPMIDNGVALVLAGETDISELIRTIDVTSRL